MHLHTPRGVRVGALALTTFGILVSGVAAAPLAYADETTPATTTPTTAPAISVGATLRTSFATLTTTRATLPKGASTVLTGSVLNGRERLAGQPTAVQLLSGTTWRTIASPRLSAAGFVSVTVKPTVTSRYRLLFAGSLGWTAATSQPLAITVRGLTSAERAAKVLAMARAQVGKWYRWGAAGPSYFDCSGLTLYAYRAVGVSLPHKANSQKSYGRAISRSQARPGDLIIFLSGGYGYHAGIYAGNGYMYDAPHAGARVGLHKIWSSNVIFRRLV